MTTDPSAGTNIILRPARPADPRHLQKIRAAAFAPIAAHAFAGAEAAQAEALARSCQKTDPSFVLGAERDGLAIGFVGYAIDREARFGEIGLNAALHVHVGRGIGARLYARALAEMKAEGVRAVEVAAGGASRHAPARRADEKVGFAQGLPSVALSRAL